MREVVRAFEDEGFGYVSNFCHLASRISDEAFSQEEFLLEQCLAGEQYVNASFQARQPELKFGELYQFFYDRLTSMEHSERLEAFEFQLFNFREAESRTTEGLPPLGTKLEARAYAEEISAGLGFIPSSSNRKRICKKGYGGWGLEGGFEVDVGGSDRVHPKGIDIRFEISIGSPKLASGALGFGFGGMLGGAGFYGQVLKPRDFTKPPIDRLYETESRMLKHAILAQLAFFNVLVSHLEQGWRA